MHSLPEHPLVFASVDHRRMRGRAFGILPADLLRHMWIIGKTGMGKSVLLEHLLVSLMQRGDGCGLIDPHGDLAARVLDLVPRSRANDVVLFDPSDQEHPIGLNVLESVTPDDRPLVASSVLSVFRKLFPDAFGPRTEHLLRNCLLALLEVRDATLLGIPRLLVEESFRERIVPRLEDSMVRFFWQKEWPTYPKAFLAEVIAAPMNKIAAVLTSPLLRNILGQRRTTIDFRTVMDEGRIFVADLSKGRIGEDASALLGAILTTRFELAAFGRADVRAAERRPFVLVIDEVGSFATPSFKSILSEARKYGLALVMAHQYLDQLDHDLRAALIGNAGTTIMFRVGADDADALGREFSPELSPEDLARLDTHQVALKLSVDALTTRPFTARTLPPRTDGAHAKQGNIIRRISAERYGTPRMQVEREIADQLGDPRAERAPPAEARRAPGSRPGEQATLC